MIAGFDRITDVHIHIQPWRELKPAVLDVMWRGEAAAQRDRLIQLMEDPRALLEVMDRAGVWRGGVERALPVMIHTGTSIFPGARSKFGNPMELDDVAIDFPNLAIVMAHGGRPLYMEEAFFILRRHPRVWLDVSGIPPARLLEYFPRLPEVADRVLWGTDWPSPGVQDMRQNIDQFVALPLSDAHRKAILETNALALFPAAR